MEATGCIGFHEFVDLDYTAEHGDQPFDEEDWNIIEIVAVLVPFHLMSPVSTAE